MPCSHRLVSLLAVLLIAPVGLAQKTGQSTPRDDKKPVPRTDPAKVGKLPLSGLTPAKLMPGICRLKYRISTASKECQDFFDQGLAFFYSYTWMEATRSFETASLHDPDCAIVWWALSRALERYGKGNHSQALKKAQDLITKASDRERLLIKARLQEKGMWPNVGDPEARKKAAIATLDELLALYPDDEEGWYARAQMAANAALFGGQMASAPFYHALLKVNPLHPGANHELVHFYENIKRPALGWHYAEKYIESSPGLPHALHMQAHLGTRIGRWDRTTDYSAKAIECQRLIHRVQGVKPKEDWQYSHHLETLMLSLIHDGRFDEARKLRAECEKEGIEHRLPWFRLHLAERDYEAALQIAERSRKNDKTGLSYMKALVYLARDENERAAAEVAVLQEAYQRNRNNKKLEQQLWEVQGILMCRQGGVEGGLKLLARLVDQTKNDYRHHAWGNGAYYMEAWGIAALRAGKLDVAEEAFLEALAHDAGSVRGALGMQVVCERQNRTEEAERFAELAQRCWRRAQPESLQIELHHLRRQDSPTTATTGIPKTEESKK